MDRRRLNDDTHALVAPHLEDRGFLAVFSERESGVSRPPYATLNLAFHTGDEPERVRRNRRRLIEALGIPPFGQLRQAHGSRLVRVGEKRAGEGFDDPDAAVEEADAAAMSRPGVPLAILTADCLPIALASPGEGRLVVVHAGWRGMAAGVLGRALGAFDRPSGVLAAIGPAIGPCHYEVGEDVALSVAAASAEGARTERRNGRLFLDLPGTAARVLRAAGVRRIDRAEECTACEEDRFFSHRRDGRTGRQAMVAMRL